MKLSQEGPQKIDDEPTTKSGQHYPNEALSENLVVGAKRAAYTDDKSDQAVFYFSLHRNLPLFFCREIIEVYSLRIQAMGAAMP
jgi:hypothetical protein